MIIASGIQVAKDFVKEATEMTVIELQGTSFNLQANAFENQGNFLFEVDNDLLNIENISLNIKKAHDSTATLALNHRAKGQNNSEARHRATQFHYPVEQTGEQLLFKESFQVPVSAKYRAQELRATLYLPLGATVFLDPSVENLIFNIDNVHNMWDGDMIGHWFVMKEAGLTCMDCEDVKFYHDYEMDEDDEGIDQAKEAIERQIESLENELNRLQNR
jgi:hypothetical protein